jgi:type II restriction/modification system DNA methylase subunit YeeA
MANKMTVKQFIEKWSKMELRERASSQSHFNDICALIGHATPTDIDPKGEFFTFEANVDNDTEKNRGWADAWYKGKFIWEYKGPHKNLDVAYQQLLRYRESLGNPPLLITSDMQKIIIHTNFTNTAKRIEVIDFDRLKKDGLQLLEDVFHNPDAFKPSETQEKITEKTSESFVSFAINLQKSGQRTYRPERLAHFVVRILFCLFAEDMGLLPDKVFSDLVRIRYKDTTAEQFSKSLQTLFKAMKEGNSTFGAHIIPWFNGGLFEDDFVPEMLSSDVRELSYACDKDWASIDPSIFGTLFERVIDESKRAQLGAHYTSKDDIMLVIEPVLMAPLRAKWRKIKTEAENQIRQGIPTAAFITLKKFSDEISSIRILDPACGSGNFLYISLRELLALQKQVIVFAEEHGLSEIRLTVGPQQLFGIELNPYAHQLAQITAWIGYIQWRYENGFADISEPILRELKQIENRDAILHTSLPAGETKGIKAAAETSWPEVDVIVGNPPFLGSRKMRPILGNEYCDALLKVYGKQIEGMPDLVCYWFEKANQQLANGKVKRVGLLGTQAIRGGTNRQVLDRIKDTGDIFMVWSDKEWILDGATVHVSIVGFDDGTEQNKSLNGLPTPTINSDLTSDVDLSEGYILLENANLSFQGIVLRGKFDMPRNKAEEMIKKSNNPNHFSNSDVLKPRRTGDDIVNRNSDTYAVDFGVNMPLAQASEYLAPFEYLKENVYEKRQTANQAVAREKWWIHWNPRTQMREALAQLPRYIATPRVAKHRIFVWLDDKILPDAQLVVFAREDDYFFGVLHSKIHELWARRKGTQLRDAESGFRYTSTTTFETFPLPWRSGEEPKDDPRYKAIAQAAKELDDFRVTWQNPADDMILGSSALQKRTLTNLYNCLELYKEKIQGKKRSEEFWLQELRLLFKVKEKSKKQLTVRLIISLDEIETLDSLHTELDNAVLDSYGWSRTIGDENILENLLKLNLERAGISQ